MTKIEELEIISILNKIERKEIELSPIDSSSLKFSSGKIAYTASNSWQITIFNDSGTWDYIDCIKLENGKRYNFDKLDESLLIRNYTQPAEIIKSIYLICEE